MATLRYRYLGAHPVHFPAINGVVKPGTVIETEQKINHPDFEEIKETKKEAPKAHN